MRDNYATTGRHARLCIALAKEHPVPWSGPPFVQCCFQTNLPLCRIIWCYCFVLLQMVDQDYSSADPLKSKKWWQKSLLSLKHPHSPVPCMLLAAALNPEVQVNPLLSHSPESTLTGLANCGTARCCTEMPLRMRFWPTVHNCGMSLSNSALSFFTRNSSPHDAYTIDSLAHRQPAALHNNVIDFSFLVSKVATSSVVIGQ